MDPRIDSWLGGGVCVHVMVSVLLLIFSAIVAIGGIGFVVLDAMDKVESIKKRAPWIEKALGHRSAMAVLLLISIVLLIGNGYELLSKEMPEVVEPPNLLFSLKAPIIGKYGAPVVTVVHGACKITENQINPARSQQVCPSVAGLPPSPRDRILAINSRLTESDRNRFSDALAEFEKSLIDGRDLFYKINEAGGKLRNDFQSNSTSAYQNNLSDLEDAGWKYQKAFPQLRSKWQQSFNEQTAYVFGDNPDNLGPGALINSVSVYKKFLEEWKNVPKSSNPNSSYFFGLASVEYQARMKMFGDWNQGCLNRLTEMRNSIR